MPEEPNGRLLCRGMSLQDWLELLRVFLSRAEPSPDSYTHTKDWYRTFVPISASITGNSEENPAMPENEASHTHAHKATKVDKIQLFSTNASGWFPF